MPILTEQERIGTLLAGRYQLDAILGRGGTGVVFEATHNWTGRKVAVKLLKPEYSRDLSLTRRFLQEARAAAGLSHPNVVQVLDMGNEKDGTVHLVLERLEGRSLGAHLEENVTLSPEETLNVLVPIMDALVLAHQQGIIHRDLKPDNIYLHKDGAGRPSPKLLDFGMSKMVDAAWGTATSSGTLVGTPFYMSPEQAEGRKDQGPQTDVWSMGVIFYRCLTGALPFWADTPTKLLMEIVQAHPKPVTERAPDVPAAFAEVVDRCLEEDLDKRWKSMGALLEALKSAAEASDIPFPKLPDPESMAEPEKFDPGPRRDKDAESSRAMGPKIAGALLAAAVVIGGILWATHDQEAVADAGTESAAEAETGAEAETEAETETVTSTETARETETETGAETETAAETVSETETETAARSGMGMGTRPRNGSDHGGMIPPSTTMETSAGAPDMRLPDVAEEW